MSRRPVADVPGRLAQKTGPLVLSAEGSPKEGGASGTCPWGRGRLALRALDYRGGSSMRPAPSVSAVIAWTEDMTE